MDDAAAPVKIPCPRCLEVAVVLDFDACYTALRAHPSIRLPPLPRSLLREALLAQLSTLAPYWRCGSCRGEALSQGD
jgi:hypothetical protein